MNRTERSAGIYQDASFSQGKTSATSPTGSPVRGNTSASNKPVASLGRIKPFRRDQQGIQQQQFGDTVREQVSKAAPPISRGIQQNQFGDQFGAGQSRFADQFGAQQQQQGFNNQMANQQSARAERPFHGPAVRQPVQPGRATAWDL